MYVVSRVDSEHLVPGHKGDKVYYAHEKATPNIPIFGSFGSYRHAKRFADMYNYPNVTEKTAARLEGRRIT